MVRLTSSPKGLEGSEGSAPASFHGNHGRVLEQQLEDEIRPADVFCLACTMLEKCQSHLPMIVKDDKISLKNPSIWLFFPQQNRDC